MVALLCSKKIKVFTATEVGKETSEAIEFSIEYLSTNQLTYIKCDNFFSKYYFHMQFLLHK